MNPTFTRIVATLLVTFMALAALLRRERESVAKASIEAAAKQAELASLKAERARLEIAATRAAGVDVVVADHLRRWQSGSRSAEAIRAASQPEESALLVTGRSPGKGSLATRARPEEAEWVDLEIAGPLPGLLAWLGQVEATHEPAAWREVRLRPGLRDVRLRATLARPVLLP